MLVIPDQHLEYPELGWNNAGFPDNLAIADNNLARGLIRAFPLNGRQTRSLVRYVIDEGFEPEKRITRTNIEHRGGRPWFNGSSSYIEYMIPHHVREDDQRNLFTMSVRFRPDRQGQTEYVMGGSVGFVSIRLQSGVVQFIRQGQAVLATDPNGAIQAGIDHTVTVIFDRLRTLDGVNAEFLYVDGRLVATGTNTVSFSWFSVPMVLGRFSSTSTSSQFRGMIDNVLWWKRALTPGEIADLHLNPGRVYRSAGSFISDIVINPTVVSAPDVSITDTASANDTLSNAVSLALTDTASGNDANPAASVTFQLSDSGSATDVLNLLRLITQNDSASAADVLAIANQLSVADSAIAADANTIAVSFTLTDTGGGIDSVTLIAETLKTINDLVSGVDSVSAVQISLAVPDSASALDAASVGASLTLADVGSANDANSLSVSLSMADTASANDVNSVLVSLAISDSATGADAVTTLQTVLKQIADAALGADQVGAVTVQVQVPEAATAVDGLSRLGALFQVLDDAGATDAVVAFDTATRIAEIRFTLSQRRMAFAMTGRSMTFTMH